MTTTDPYRTARRIISEAIKMTAQDPNDVEGFPPDVEPHFPELRQLSAIDPEFRDWLGAAACPEVQRCSLWPACSHEP